MMTDLERNISPHSTLPRQGKLAAVPDWDGGDFNIIFESTSTTEYRDFQPVNGMDSLPTLMYYVLMYYVFLVYYATISL